MSWIDNWKEKRRYRSVMTQCGCVIKCQKCGDIQNDNAECKKLDEHRYEYICGKCGNVAIALFGIFPLPVWESTVLQTKQKIADLPDKFAPSGLEERK